MDDHRIVKFNQCCRDNPDLPRAFVKGVLEAQEQVESGNVKPYIRRTPRLGKDAWVDH